MSRENKTDSERLASIETMVSVLVESRKEELAARHEQDKRIRLLEVRDAYVFGAGAALSALAPIVAKKVFGI